MDVITLEKEKVPGEKISAFEKELTESGMRLPDGEVLAALAGEDPAAEGSIRMDESAAYRGRLTLSYLPDTPEEVLRTLTEALVQRLQGTEVTLVLCMVPEGEGAYSHALEDCGFEKEGTIPGYFCRDGMYQDADLYALDLREDDEDDGEERQRTYVISMLRDGYDDGNTAYFCGVDEAYVAAVRQELGIPEPET
ncbi:MAG: hypothetical protein ACI4OJ_12335 [Lachnospiraceae bacterium]